jgi:hypothetical protein
MANEGALTATNVTVGIASLLLVTYVLSSLAVEAATIGELSFTRLLHGPEIMPISNTMTIVFILDCFKVVKRTREDASTPRMRRSLVQACVAASFSALCAQLAIAATSLIAKVVGRQGEWGVVFEWAYPAWVIVFITVFPVMFVWRAFVSQGMMVEKRYLGDDQNEEEKGEAELKN